MWWRNCFGASLGATGALKAVTCLHGLRRSGGKRGLVTMCGSGMGAAGLFGRLTHRCPNMCRARSGEISLIANKPCEHHLYLTQST